MPCTVSPVCLCQRLLVYFFCYLHSNPHYNSSHGRSNVFLSHVGFGFTSIVHIDINVTLKYFSLLLFYVNGSFAFMHFFVLRATCELSTKKVRKRCHIPRDWSQNVCKLPCKCWELNLSPLEQQSVLLTIDPFLYPQTPIFFS